MNFLKNNEHVSMKKVLGILFLIFAGLLVAGCSDKGIAEDNGTEVEETVVQNEQAIRAVIEQEFTGPDEEVIQLKEKIDEKILEKMEEAPEESVITLSEEDLEQQNYQSYLEKTYASHFTDKAFNDFSATYAFSLHQPGGNYKMKIADLEIVRSGSTSRNYQFTVYVDYENPAKETTQYEIGGNTIITEKGKIGKIDFNDKDGLSGQINEDNRE